LSTSIDTLTMGLRTSGEVKRMRLDNTADATPVVEVWAEGPPA